MTAQDHNKTLGIIYSFLGAALTVAGVLILKSSLNKDRGSAELQFNTPSPTEVFPLELILIATLLAVFLLLTAYGLFRKRKWARISALILSGIFVWLFPLGTILAVYTWWFMHSEGAKHIYYASVRREL